MPKYVALPGSRRTLLPQSRAAGPVDPSEIDTLTVRLRSAGDSEALEKRVYEEAQKPVKDRQYLSRAEVTALDGANPADLDRVEDAARRHNLMVVSRSAPDRTIVLKGAVGDLLKLFPAELGVYHHATGTYRGRAGEIHVPEELAGIVTGVFGFDTRPKQRAPYRGRAVAMKAGPGGANGVPATAFADRYNFPRDHQGVTLDGSGQTIAIIELGGGFRTSDLAAYFDEIGSPTPSVTAISVDHAGNAPSTPDSDDGEVMLDIEVAGAVVPNARLAVYFAPNRGDKGFLDAIRAAINDSERNPSVISISWGGPESTSDQQGIQAFHELFVTAAAQGITVCAATGDHGTADLDGASWDQQIHVDHPAVDPLVLACGGTQVNGNGADEVWNDGTPFDPGLPGGGGWATGGGISQVFPVPDYQKAANLPVSIVTGQPGRGIPDIAMSATNYFTRVDSSEGASGGTSAVAPLMAALVARLNQAANKRVGLLQPLLYTNAAQVTKDVTTGDNGINGTVAGYKAGPGWDACSGLGTPDGGAILNNL
jgi:kumamolisin